MLRIASFDIGKKNFAFYVEDCEIATIKTLKKQYRSLPKKMQRRIKGPMNSTIKDIHLSLFKTSKKIEFGVFDIRENKDSNELDIKTRMNMHSLLQSRIDLWQSCHIVIVEQQYFNISNGRKTKPSGANVDAIKLGECCINWFLITFGTFKEILYFGSMFKTHTLGAPDKLTKPQRKKWSIGKSNEILELRGDSESIELMKNYKNSKGKKQKMDDIADCIIMTQAYKFMKLIAE